MTGPGWLRERRATAGRDEVVALLREGTEAPYAPVGSGSHLGRGGSAAAPCTALDLGGLDRVVEHAVEDLTVTVEAGMPLGVLRDLLARHGQWFPPDPGGDGTVGGLLAADRRSALAGGFGSMRDFVLGVTVADGRGRMARAGGRVVKNVAGYDLMKLMAGSLGEFGVILEATLRVLACPERWGLVTVPEDPTDATLARRILEDAPRQWFPTGLFKTNVSGRLEIHLLFAGGEARVAAQTEGAARALGSAAVRGDDDAAAAFLERLRGVTDPTGPAGWGGALASVLAAPGVATAFGDRPWAGDLMRGHLWCTAEGATDETAARLRNALAVGEGHLHLEASADAVVSPSVWGSDPGAEGDLWRGLKRALDPDGRLVAGRLPGGV